MGAHICPMLANVGFLCLSPKGGICFGRAPFGFAQGRLQRAERISARKGSLMDPEHASAGATRRMCCHPSVGAVLQRCVQTIPKRIVIPSGSGVGPFWARLTSEDVFREAQP